MKWKVGNKIGVGFALVLFLYLTVGIVSYRSTSQLLEASELRKHTYEVASALDRAFSLLQDVETGQRSYLLVGNESFFAQHAAALPKIDPILQDVRRLTLDNPRQQRRLDRLEPIMKSRLELSKDTVNLGRTNAVEAAVALVKSGQGDRYMDDIRRLIGEMEAEEHQLLQERADQSDAYAQKTKWTIVVGTLASVVLSALVGIMLTRDISRPLQNLTGVAERITVGDLDVNVSSNGRSDEVGTLAHTFDRMTQSLRKMAGAAERIAAGDLRTQVQPHSLRDVLGNAFLRMSENLRDQTRGIMESAGVLGAAASEIVASTAQLSTSATESATAVSETTTTVAEVRQTSQVASQKARAVADSAQKAAQISLTGRKSTEEAAAGMNRIRQQMEAIASSMVRLSEQSQTIGQIIATVEDLAAQSNLLAVNAAIEAAKAGEHGKGFSVVAQEVKSLAEQSRLATNQVRTILNDIQKATAAAVMATEQGSKAVEVGEKQTSAAGESIQALAGSVSEAAQSATQIAASSQQQLVGMDQVAIAMENIKQSSTQNVASARQLETAARNLQELGQRLKLIVERYQV